MLAVNETVCVRFFKRPGPYVPANGARRSIRRCDTTDNVCIVIHYIILTGSKPATVAQRKSPSPQVNV